MKLSQFFFITEYKAYYNLKKKKVNTFTLEGAKLDLYFFTGITVFKENFPQFFHASCVCQEDHSRI